MRVKYILPLILSVFAFSIFSQPPIWQFVNFNTPSGQSVTIPLYMTQLVYQVNITQSTPLQYVQITVPQSILQQQLQYCKTYDPFITNISVTQCAFAYPNVVIFYNNPYSSPPSMPNGNAYEIPYHMTVLSYDDVTGLPQTFQIFINNHMGSLPTGTYYIYVYYGGPYYISFASTKSGNLPNCLSLTQLSYATPGNFNGGWCGSGSINMQYSLPWGQVLNSLGSSATRYLFVKFDPQYPVLIGGFNILYCSFCGISSYVTVRNPSTGQTVNLTIGQGTIYDLRTLEEQNNIDPYQFNEILSISYSQGGSITIPGVVLIYTPQT